MSTWKEEPSKEFLKQNITQSSSARGLGPNYGITWEMDRMAKTSSPHLHISLSLCKCLQKCAMCITDGMQDDFRLSCFNSHVLFLNFLMFIYFWEGERDRAWVWERQRERETQNLRQAPGSKLSAQSLMWGWNQEPWDHDLSWSRMLNQLSHPGAPKLHYLNLKTELPDIAHAVYHTTIIC